MLMRLFLLQTESDFITKIMIVWMILLSFAAAAPVFSQDVSTKTHEVFDKYSEKVIKIQVVESSSGAKAGIGSGFYVSAGGHIITNFHVISKLIHHPERYRAEFIGTDEVTHSLDVLNIDVINDLALVRSELEPSHYFQMKPLDIRQGTRLYSLGYPHDIGKSIVEGTYNGLMDYALYKKIHFTSSINPGMSGGPAITSTGKVVGVNVSTAGNQVSFLVPVKAAIDLFNSTMEKHYKVPGSFIDIVRSQLLSHQASYLNDDLMRSGTKIRLGDFMLPSKLAPFFKCWGDSDQKETKRYKTINHKCSTDDYLFISGSQRSGIIDINHRLITTDELNPIAFYTLYSALFSQYTGYLYGNEDDVTSYKCETDIVGNDRLPFKVAFCVRRYKKLEGLYDMVFKAAVLGRGDTGLETTLILSGVSFEKAVDMAKGYLEAISWKE
jgi:serine protease Do